MKLFISGGTGFVGKVLTRYMLNMGHEVTCSGRSPHMNMNHENFHYISTDTSQKGSWQEVLKESDAVINLAGASIFNRWTPQYKQLLYDSRILTTRNIVEGMNENKDTVLVSTSAVGYYGDGKDDILLENAPPGNDFLAKLGVDWEAEALKAKKKGCRVAIARFGIILGEDGGALKTMLPIFKFFLGGPLGTGKQWFPWIHIKDVIGAIALVVENSAISGPLNFTSPIPIRQKAFAKALGRRLKRPSFMPAPSFMVGLIMGELGASLMASQKAIPDQLIRHGYKFSFLEIDEALADILNHRS